MLQNKQNSVVEKKCVCVVLEERKTRKSFYLLLKTKLYNMAFVVENTPKQWRCTPPGRLAEFFGIVYIYEFNKMYLHTYDLMFSFGEYQVFSDITDL